MGCLAALSSLVRQEYTEDIGNLIFIERWWLWGHGNCDTPKIHEIFFSAGVTHTVFSWISWLLHFACVSHENPFNSNITVVRSIVLFFHSSFLSWFLPRSLLSFWGISPLKSGGLRRCIQLITRSIYDPILPRVYHFLGPSDWFSKSHVTQEGPIKVFPGTFQLG